MGLLSKFMQGHSLGIRTDKKKKKNNLTLKEMRPKPVFYNTYTNLILITNLMLI